MPTGTGKSVCIADLAMQVIQGWSGQKVIMATHVKELIEQNMEKLRLMWPTAPAGIYSAGLKKYESFMPIVYGGIASMVGNGSKFGYVTMLIIDEAHLLSLKETGMYQRFIAELKIANPRLKVIGYTATPFRQGQGMLTDGTKEKPAMFNKIVYDACSFKAFNWFLNEGYLAYLRPFPTDSEMSTEGIRIIAGEYDKKQAQEKANDYDKTYACCKELVEKAVARNHWLTFGTGVAHTEMISSILNDEFGIATTFVHSKMDGKVRDQRILDYKAGKYRCLVNNGILTTGFDFPALDCIAVMRLTNSTGLWVQILGRGTRPLYASGFDLSTREGRLAAIANSDKPDCLVLDFAGNSARLGPINDPQIPKAKGKSKPGGVPLKLCEGCGMMNHASVIKCANPNCECEFFRELKLSLHSSTDEVIKTSEEIKVEVFKVSHVTYALHSKHGGSTSIRVSYHTTNFKLYEEWINVEAPGKRAERWWRAREGGEMPRNTLEALRAVEELRKPYAIHVNLTNKYPEIINYEWAKADCGAS